MVNSIKSELDTQKIQVFNFYILHKIKQVSMTDVPLQYKPKNYQSHNFIHHTIQSTNFRPSFMFAPATHPFTAQRKRIKRHRAILTYLARSRYIAPSTTALNQYEPSRPPATLPHPWPASSRCFPAESSHHP